MPIMLNNIMMIIGSFYHVEVYSYLQCPEYVIMDVMSKDKQQFPDAWEAKSITKGSNAFARQVLKNEVYYLQIKYCFAITPIKAQFSRKIFVFSLKSKLQKKEGE